MFKIKYIPTGNIFILPEKIAIDLKEKSPSEYQILEKDGKKFRDKIHNSIKNDNSKSIRSKVVEVQV